MSFTTWTYIRKKNATEVMTSSIFRNKSFFFTLTKRSCLLLRLLAILYLIFSNFSQDEMVDTFRNILYK